jgi:hypothetical protein
VIQHNAPATVNHFEDKAKYTANGPSEIWRSIKVPMPGNDSDIVIDLVNSQAGEG